MIQQLPPAFSGSCFHQKCFAATQRRLSLFGRLFNANDYPSDSIFKSSNRKRSIRNSSSSRTEKSIEQQCARFSSVYDPSHGMNWRKWFTPAEYENPWDARSPRFASGSLSHRAADNATKHVIAQLQTFHHFDQHVSTELCNTMLANLHDLLPTTHKVRSNVSTSSSTDPAETIRIAERAYSILQNMELFHALTRAASANQKLPRPLPKPNRETYNTVLLILSKTASYDRTIPDIAAEIVQQMQRRYDTQQDLDMKPVHFHWNCVLLSWLNCMDWEKPVHAIQLLIRNATSPDASSLVDASSYVHALRICLYAASSNTETSNEKAAQLGANVAVKLWQEMFERSSNDIRLHVPPNLPSHFYSHFLQAIRPLPLRSVHRDAYYAACMQRASEEGKINLYVLQDFFIHVKSPEIFNRFLGSFRQQVHGMTADEAVRRILQLMPPEWTANAD